MPNTILKRWNGSSFEELYPKTTVTQISATGTPSASTVLAGNGAWIASNGHSHGSITNEGTITSDTAIASGQKIVLVNASNQIVRSTLALGTATTTFLRNDGQWVTPAGGGTVTSVTGTSPIASSGGNTPAISLAASYGDTQNPYASKTTKTFLAAPNAANGVPTFRTILASDIPTLNQNTTGSAATLTTARTLTIGSTGKTFNGGANVSWSLAEIGASATSHTHATSDITSGSFLTQIFATTLATNASSGSITVASGTARLWFFASMSGSTTIRIMFPVNFENIGNTSTVIYRYGWNNGSFSFFDNLTINRTSATAFNFAHSSGNSPWDFRVYSSQRL